jgi:hypothetical protein
MAKPLKMSKNTIVDPTISRTELKLGKETYFLCFTFGALAIAQKNLREVGVTCNLLHALDLSSMDAEKFVPLLYAALITHHPTITPEQVANLVTFKNMGSIFEGIAAAYGASLADPDADSDSKQDPQPAE